MATVTKLDADAVELQLRIERFHAVREGIMKQVRQVIVGQQDVLEQMLIALFVGGHCLVTGMPGTAKTLMVRAGVRPDISERVLGHVIGGVRGVYDRHEYRDEKARAYEALARQLDFIVHRRVLSVTLRRVTREAEANS